MTPEELSIYEKFNHGDLRILAALISAIRGKVDTANDTSELALAKITNAMLLNTDAWPSTQKFQKVSAPTQFGVDDANGKGARGTHFIFGSYGFLGYQNNADTDLNTVIDPDYAFRTGQDLRDIEVVNRRTLQLTLSNVQNDIQGTFLRVDGGTGNTGAEFSFSILVASERAEYLELPNYASFKPTSFANKGYVDTAFSGALATALTHYLPKSGGSISGGLTVMGVDKGNPKSVALLEDLAAVTGDPIFDGTVVHRPEVAHLLDNPHIASLRVEKTPSLDQDALRLTDIDDPTFFPLKTYPIWTSNKFILSPSISDTKAGGSYDTEIRDIDNQPQGAYYVRLLKLDGQSTWDASDAGFKTRFAQTQRLQIEGAEISAVNTRLPFPVEYELMLEYTVNPDSAILGFLPKRSRFRTPIASNSEFKHSLFLNDVGQLSLLVQPGPISVPWVNGKVNVLGHDLHEPRFFVVVKKWSYCAQSYKALDSAKNTVFVGMDDVTIYADGPLTKSFRISTGGFDPDQTLHLTALDSSNTALVPSPSPLTGTTLTIPFTSNASEQVTLRLAVSSGVDLSGRPIDLSEPLTFNYVTIRKRPIAEAPPVEIRNSNLVLKRVNGFPAQLMSFEFAVVLAGGVGPFEITLSDLVGTSAYYSSETGKVTGTFVIDSNQEPSFSLNVNDLAKPGVHSKTISATFPNENVTI